MIWIPNRFILFNCARFATKMDVRFFVCLHRLKYFKLTIHKTVAAMMSFCQRWLEWISYDGKMMRSLYDGDARIVKTINADDEEFFFHTKNVERQFKVNVICVGGDPKYFFHVYSVYLLVSLNRVGFYEQMSHEIWARLVTFFNRNYEPDNEICVFSKLQIELAIVTISSRDRRRITKIHSIIYDTHANIRSSSISLSHTKWKKITTMV